MRLGSSRRSHEEAPSPEVNQPQSQQVVYAPTPQEVPVRANNSRRPGIAIVFIAVLLMIVAIACAVWFKTQGSSAAIPIEKDKYQAVFMSGGQVYFGKLEVLNAGYVELSDVFYTQSAESSETGDACDDCVHGRAFGQGSLFGNLTG